ncbi:LuxR C-terminal-related transcriptional regulator [Euzebya sp.]|uniref:LuxR C-terminal-related transcriptional regulator n=1 Tax=Euzebya sp. TaxID=1971409 RepID=UPI003513D7D8
MTPDTAETRTDPERIRVFMVDDHHMFLTGVQAEINARVEVDAAATQIDVVGTAQTVEAAVAGIAETEPDVVLLDVHMPDGGGLAVITAVRADRPDIQFLALSVSDAAEDVIAIVRAGARGYLTKTVSADDLVEGIARVHGGDAVFSPRLAGFVLDAFSGSPPPTPEGQPDESDLDVLTPREREVLRYIARGYAYKQVASRLHISIKTVESHVSAVLRKLQLSSRYELTRWATDRKLV